MAAARIKILKKILKIEAGRQQEQEPELHYETWCEVGSLYGDELYKALDIRLKNTVVFECRYCRKIKEMQQHLKDYYIEFEGEKYDVYASDFRKNERQYVQLKANRID